MGVTRSSMEDIRNAFKILAGKNEVEEYLEHLRVDRRVILKLIFSGM
jgi:uncharacterized short protein YbdD (DUF466 family)